MQAAAPAPDALNLDAVWNSIQRNIHDILHGHSRDCSFEKLYRHVFIMCFDLRNGRLVYNGVRQMVKQRIDEMVPKLVNMAQANIQEWNSQLAEEVILQVDQLWSSFGVPMQCICDGVMFMERSLPENGGGELAADFAWRLFCSEILANELVKQAMATRLVFNPGNRIQTNSSDDDAAIAVDYKESPLFNVDTIIEIMTFLTTFKLGLQISTAARQMAKLSDYVLNKRKPILRPIVISLGIEGEEEMEPFATKLQEKNVPNPEGKKMVKIFNDWHTSMASESRICLPDIDPPEWLAGVELIYVMADGLHDKTFRFFNALRDQLQNCQLILNISGFFAKLQQAGLSSQFFHFFNWHCFSLAQAEIPCRNSFVAKWPLWAIFNNIFFPNCRELILPVDDNLTVDEVEAAKWLAHPSTESRPRLLKLRASQNWHGDGFGTMLQRIKEDFLNPTGKRMFFVEFPNGSDLPAWQLGEWQNGNGEQLRIESAKITRLSEEQGEKVFKDFYELPTIQSKLVFE